MNVIKKIFKSFLYFLLIPISYIIISLILSLITVNTKEHNQNSNNLIYLTTNGVHLDVVIPVRHLDSLLLSGMKYETTDKYLSFGWGDENFYINTPTWEDLTFTNAFKSLFLKSTVLH